MIYPLKDQSQKIPESTYKDKSYFIIHFINL